MCERVRERGERRLEVEGSRVESEGEKNRGEGVFPGSNGGCLVALQGGGEGGIGSIRG